MNGARALPEDMAKRRLYINSLPGMAEENKREHDCFTLHAADLLMLEVSVAGNAAIAADLARNAVPRPWCRFLRSIRRLSDANVLITAKSGGGKTFMAQLFLTMMAGSIRRSRFSSAATPIGRWSSSWAAGASMWTWRAPRR